MIFLKEANLEDAVEEFEMVLQMPEDEIYLSVHIVKQPQSRRLSFAKFNPTYMYHITQTSCQIPGSKYLKQIYYKEYTQRYCKKQLQIIL